MNPFFSRQFIRTVSAALVLTIALGLSTLPVLAQNAAAICQACASRCAALPVARPRSRASARTYVPPAQVIVAILTDGAENSSQNYTWHQLAGVIRRQTEQYRWTFLFLGANQDAIATAAQMNIAAANAANYVHDEPGLHASSKAIGRKVRALRSFQMSSGTLQERADESASLSDLLAEEDRKERS